MPLTLLTGPANAGKARFVIDTLRAARARGHVALLVVPTREDVVRYRRELAEDGLTAGVRVRRFGELLEEVVARAGPAEPPLGRAAYERVLAAVLARSGSGPRPHLRAGSGTVRALAALVGELEVARVSPARLRAALGEWAAAEPGHAAHARAVGDLYEDCREALAQLAPARATPERRAAHALDALRAAPTLWGATPLALYGFDDLTPLQLDAIETLGVVVDAPVTVSLAYEPGRVAFAGRGATFQRLRPLAAEHLHVPARADHYAPSALAETGTRAEGPCLPASVALHHLERSLFEPAPPSPVAAGGAVRLLEGGGERAELELVAEEVAGLLARGWAPGEIAVAHRAPAGVADLLEEVFRARGVPFALERRVPFAHTVLGRALLGLLAAAFPEDDERGLADLLAWLRAPGVLPSPEPADALELRARRTGALTVARARALWEAEHGPLAALDRLREAARRGPAALLDSVTDELERLAAGAGLADEPAEARVLSLAQDTLGELAELARSASGLAPDARGLLAALRDLELVVGAPPADADAVAVLDPLALRARRVRALFLCGLQEGVFPAPAPAEPFLAAEERRALALASGLVLARTEDALAAERYLFYAAVSRPTELLVLSWHAADDDGLARPRSLFVDDVCDLFTCDLHGARFRRALGEVGEGDGDGAALVEPDGVRVESGGPRVGPDGPGEGGVAPLSDPRVLAELGARPWSASSLSTWAACPVRWFVERLLGAGGLDPDAEPLARGALAHAALRDVFDGLRRETGSARLTPRRLPRARELLGDALATHAAAHPLSTVPERLPGARRRLEVDLERYLAHAAARADDGEGSAAAPASGSAPRSNGSAVRPETPLEPTHLELPFGFAAGGGQEDGAAGLPALDLGEGVRVRGYVDRVDLAPGGEAVVYDYKGAHAAPPATWLSERAFQVALYMRAVEQLPGVRAVGGFYQPLAGRDLRPRGVLARDEGVELSCVRGDAREPAAVAELVEEVVAAAREAAVQARAGALQARPDSCGFGGSGCAYPEICRCER